MESGCKTPDYNEIDPCVAERMNCSLELHQESRRAAPRTRSSTVEASSSFLARSSGVNRNCSTKQCQIYAIVPGRFDSASTRGVKQTIFRPRQLLRR
jgi:hypothetical protein